MGRYIVDAETNGLLHELDVVHCIVLKNIDNGDILSCADQPGYPSIERALDYLSEATEIIGHNVINFDLRALNKVYPSLALDVNCGIYDTLNMSRLLWPELEPVDRAKFSHIDSKFIGRHSLAAWGERLGVAKIKFKEENKKITENVWAHWSQSMSVYCEGDVAVTHKLYNYLQTQEADPRSVELEHEFAKVMAMQESLGFPFNEKAAFALVNTLKAERSELDEQLQEVFLPVVENRVSAKTGKPLKSKVTVFNPASRQQTAERLQACYPEIVFNSTEKGNVKVDDDVLELLGEKYPEAKILARYQLLNKRIAQIADGKEAWLKHCQIYGDGRIHGTVVTNACVSGRCSHKRPNMAQVPSVGHAYGA
jgi:DNA polymerase I-like protein with 3'-5' exonuclease and polymerase domains